MTIPTGRATASALAAAALMVPSTAAAAPSAGVYAGKTRGAAIAFALDNRGSRVRDIQVGFVTRCADGKRAKRTISFPGGARVRAGRFSARSGLARVTGRFTGATSASGTLRAAGRDPRLGRCDTGTLRWTARLRSPAPSPVPPPVQTPQLPAQPQSQPSGQPAPPPSQPPVEPPPAANRPPQFPNPFTFNQTTHFEYDSFGRLVGATTTIDVTSPATDPDGDPLTYAWTASNGQITGDGLSATWTRTIAFGRVQGGTVTVTASDGRGGTDTFTIEFR